MMVLFPCPSQDAAHAREEGEQALKLAEQIRGDAEMNRADVDTKLALLHEKEKQLAQVRTLVLGR